MRKIILASGSPTRAALFEKFGFDFEIVKSNCEESSKKEDPKELVREHAVEKARDVAQKYEDAIIIGADTVAVIDNEIIGKPRDAAHAVEILQKLSGREHVIYTGLCFIDTKNKQELVDLEETTVKFKNLSEKEIRRYVATGEPLGKAGAYTSQERAAIFIEWIKGDFNNLAGVPFFKISENLKKLGFSVI